MLKGFSVVTEELCCPSKIRITYKMSEVCHHPPTLTLCHVQGLGCGPQDIETPISAPKAHQR